MNTINFKKIDSIGYDNTFIDYGSSLGLYKTRIKNCIWYNWYKIFNKLLVVIQFQTLENFIFMRNIPNTW